MPLQCPHCQNTIAVVGPTPREVVCPACGSTIELEPGGTAPFMPEEAPRRLGRFELLELLGETAADTSRTERCADVQSNQR